MQSHIIRLLRATRCSQIKAPLRNCSTSSAYKPIKRPSTPSSEAISSHATPRRVVPNNPEHPNDAQPPPPLADRLQMYIKAAGPISVAKYMKEVLTNWSGGYYMSKDVFGQQGDFITSPEIGQIFGELVAVWLYTEWQKCGSPRPLQIIELGPGRGTMIQDVLRVLSRVGGIAKADLSVHLVEVSPFMSEAQAQRLCLKSEARTVHPDGNDPALHFRSGETVSGIPVFWYHRLEDVPDAFSVVLAHEFFDALPIHKFVKLENKWREVLIDVDNENPDERKGLRFVASKTETPMLRVFLQQLKDDEKREHIERSFEAQQLVEHLATRIEQHGGFGLIMDYGHTGDGQDTFRAFKAHKQQDPLLRPGSADLTADVDFQRLREVAETDQRLITFGPVEQGAFLKRLNGDQRLEQLLAGAQTPEAKDALRSGYEMLTSPTQMGSRFKFMSMFPSVLRDHLKRYPVNGFD